ncbi:phage virion morphogenesis protein [Halothiobacillus diazotrophicus]|nr:phage virion morphogenesis protein [Halothiobacillus diazotrophicus]
MLTINVNDRFVVDALSHLMQHVTDMQPAMASIGQELVTRISNRFETQTDPMGHPWAQWAESTKKSYPEDGNGRILDRYGDMLDSLNFQADSDSSKIGFGDPVAVFHEFSTRYMPGRQMIFDDPVAGTISPADQKAIIDIVQGYLLSD